MATNSKKYDDITINRGICSLFGNKINVYLYLVDGLLFDCGPSQLKSASSQFFRANKIDQVALTHVHEDHSGMAAWLQQNMNVPVYLHELAIPQAHKKGKYPLYRRIMWGKRPSFNPQPIPDSLQTARHTFAVIESPGHMEYHKVFYEKQEGWLFTGDLYVGAKQRVAFKDENMQDSIASLRKLLQLDFQTVFCAHAGPVEQGKTALQKKLDYLLDLQGKVENLRRQGMSNREIDKKLFPVIPLITRVSGGEWSSYNIVSTI